VFSSLRDGAVFARTGDWEGRVVCVWPSAGKLRWPPPENTWITNEEEFELLTEAVAIASPPPTET